MAYIGLLKPVPTEKLLSTDPFKFNRINLLDAFPSKVVKSPPTKSFPSVCSNNKLGVSLGFVPMVKLLSKSPFGNKRMTLFTASPLYLLKLPAAIIEPSGCSTMEYTVKLNPVPVLNEVSKVPSKFNRIKRFTVTPLYLVKLPATRSFRSGSTTTSFTVLSGPD